MRFFHISDLHFGKLLYGYDLTEEHRNFIEQLGDYCDKYNPDAVLIAGDVYDRSVPSADAMTLLDELLNKLSGRKVFIISGNHDNAKRLSFGKDFLKKHDIYISTVPQTGENEKIEKVTFADEYGNVNIYMLPFLKPALFKNSMPEEAAAGEDAIIKKLVENTDIDKNERNIILAHQFFVSGHKEPELCESEQTPAIVGGLDAVDVSAFDDFEYAALGHIHGGQFVGSEKNRYSGTPIKFSVSERNHNKNIVMVDMEEKNKEIEITKLPLTQIRDVFFGELLDSDCNYTVLLYTNYKCKGGRAVCTRSCLWKMKCLSGSPWRRTQIGKSWALRRPMYLKTAGKRLINWNPYCRMWSSQISACPSSMDWNWHGMSTKNSRIRLSLC